MELKYDVLIVGTGISGLYTALNLRNDLNILMITKGKIEDTNSYLAQGGISTAKTPSDIPLFIEDTLKAGKNKNSKEAVTILAKESMENIKELVKLGVEFDSTNGNFTFTREGAHSINRIVHVKDQTGKAVAQTLIERVKERSNITLLEGATLIDILSKDNTCYGGIVVKDSKQMNIHAKSVILATGGIGGLFINSTNQRALTGDSISIALKHNIVLKDLEYIQIHPTAFYEENSSTRRFLISEALRGEGAKLININGERFVDELLPRDVVSKAIFEEMKKTNSKFVYLDISFLDSDYLINRFPAIYENCLDKGVDITKEPIPVSPAQHYFMGGIETDLNSCTSMKHLYAVGETSCTGVHGANRLASNSILEALVFSKRASNSINNSIDNILVPDITAKNVSNNYQELIAENKTCAISEFKRRVPHINVEFCDCR